MEENKFFRLVWRINSLIILGGSSLIALFIAYNVIKYFLRPSHQPEPVVVENLAEDPENKEKWVIGSPIYIEGNDYLLLPLISESDEVKIKSTSKFSRVSYNKYYGNSSKNILFLNKKTNESFWLFENTSRLILDTTLFPNNYRDKETTKAIFYNVVSKDTNNDKKLNYQDDLSLYMSNPEGGDYQLVLDVYDKIISRTSVEDNQMVIVFQKNGKAFSRLIQLSPYKIISNVELPKIKNS